MKVRSGHNSSKPALLIIRAISAAAQQGRLQFGAFDIPCALGRSGVRAIKQEGDGATPRGRFRLRAVLFRPHLAARPRTAIALRGLRTSDGWCDSPSDRSYNRMVRLPYTTSTERMWREDGLYDVVGVIGYNDVPRIRNRGSAIFLHIARPGLTPTEGCIALRPRDLRRLLAAVPRYCQIVIEI